MSIQKILLPIDFSEHSRLALDRGIEIAHATSAQIDLVHAIEELVYRGVRYTEALSPNALEERREERIAQLEEWREIAQRAGVEASAQIVSGDPRNAVLEHAERTSPDLIVIGSHGRSRLRTALLGSVSEYVLRAARCDVLLVKAARA